MTGLPCRRVRKRSWSLMRLPSSAKANVLAATLAIVLSSCGGSPGAEQAKNEVVVLVDLSETWHNAGYSQRNERTLGEIGYGIAAAADDVDPPYDVQYRVIGSASYEREPICDVEFMPSLVLGNGHDARRITRLSKLRDYVATDCPRQLLTQPAEAQTEITAALRSVQDEPRPPGAQRYIVVASDFLEESRGQADLKNDGLNGTNILLLYRPLTEDQLRPDDTSVRVKYWQDMLTSKGALVTSMPDTALRRSQIAAFLTSKTGTPNV